MKILGRKLKVAGTNLERDKRQRENNQNEKYQCQKYEGEQKENKIERERE